MSKIHALLDTLESQEMTERFSMKDDILSGITFEELIMTLQANEPVIDKKSVEKVFAEILNMKVSDAKSELKKNLSHILKEAN